MQVTYRWDQIPVRPGDGPQEEAGYGIRPHELNRLLQVAQRLGSRIDLSLWTVVRIEDVHYARVSNVVGPAARIAGQRDGTRGCAVIGAVARNDLVAAGDPAGHLDGVFVGLGAGEGEEHLIDVAGEQLGQLLSQPGSRLMSHEGVDEGQFLGLALDRIDDARVAVSGVDAHELAIEVDDAFAVGRIEIDAFGVIDGNRVGCGLGRPVVERVLAAHRDDLFAAQDMRPRTRLYSHRVVITLWLVGAGAAYV